LCIDNDEAGLIFAREIEAQISGAKTILPQQGKDWNDRLTSLYSPHPRTPS